MLSVIIPTLNEEKILPCLLKSINRQTLKEFEVIIADNNSIDNTRMLATKAGAIVVDGGLPARARNNGAKAARGEWLLFLDADVVLPPDFLEKAMDELRKQNLSAASCLVDPLSDKRLDGFLHETANLYLQATESFFPHAPGFCIFCKKKNHEAVGGFDENIKLAEDHDYVQRLSKITEFGLLKGIRIPVSVRRLEKDGRLNVTVKYLAVEAHLIFLGPICTDIFNYKFGHYS